MKIILTIDYDESKRPLSDIPRVCAEFKSVCALVLPNAAIRCEVDPDE